MINYVDLEKLTINLIDDAEVVVKGCVFNNISDNDSILMLNKIIKPNIELLINSLDAAKIHLFIFDFADQLNEETFESIVNICLSSLFMKLCLPTKGRPRERRLDVPEQFKLGLNCNMSLVKYAVNYKTLIDKFQVVINCGDLHYILVGGANDE